jgi:hypothetical protein
VKIFWYRAMAKGPGVPITFHFIALNDQLIHYKLNPWSMQPFFVKNNRIGRTSMYYTNLSLVMQGEKRIFADLIRFM